MEEKEDEKAEEIEREKLEEIEREKERKKLEEKLREREREKERKKLEEKIKEQKKKEEKIKLQKNIEKVSYIKNYQEPKVYNSSKTIESNKIKEANKAKLYQRNVNKNNFIDQKEADKYSSKTYQKKSNLDEDFYNYKYHEINDTTENNEKSYFIVRKAGVIISSNIEK